MSFGGDSGSSAPEMSNPGIDRFSLPILNESEAKWAAERDIIDPLVQVECKLGGALPIKVLKSKPVRKLQRALAFNTFNPPPHSPLLSLIIFSETQSR